MRKLLTKTTILAILTVGIMTMTAAAAEIGTGVVDASSLRLRSEPSLNSSTLAYLPDKTVVAVYEELDGWYKVVYNGLTGYVSAQYLNYTPNATDEPYVEDKASPEKEAGSSFQGTITGHGVNFRSEPDTASKVIARLAKGADVEVVSTADGWCKVVYNGQTGYVYATYVEVKEQSSNGDSDEEEVKRGIVTGSCVNVRSGPSTSNGIVTKVYAGAILELFGLSDNWYYIRYNGYSGYISADYVREYKGNTTSAIGEQAAALAMSFLGVPYVWGGASPSGFDCSGFTLYIFKQFGYSLSHSASAQWANSGEYVERSDLQPGDLVFFADPSRSNGKACSHCGIYIGDGKFIHASSSSSGKYVRISDLTTGYYNTYYKGAKRIG